MTRIEASDPPERLNQISQHQFYNLVDNDVRNRLDETVARKLREPIVVPRWTATLKQMKALLDGSIAAKKADSKARRLAMVAQLEGFEQQIRVSRHARNTDTEIYVACLHSASELRTHIVVAAGKFEEWRQRSIRMKSAIDERLNEALWLSGYSDPDLQARLDGAITRVRQLTEAIDRHRREIDPLDASDIDQALWAVLPV